MARKPKEKQKNTIQSKNSPENKLFYGDCLTVMQQEMEPESVDLIYLDPPFNSARDYNAIYKDETGRPLPDQIDAFCDTWKMDSVRERAIRAMPVLMREYGIDDDVVEFWRLWMNALRSTQPALLAYLSYMTERLLPMKSLLKSTGSIYLHCDPTSGHYIKMMMDTIFGHKNFQNEIIWWYDTGGMAKTRWSRKHDILLFYSGSSDFVFNVQDVMDEKNESQKRRFEMSKKWGDKSTYRLTSDKKYPHDVWKMHAINPKAKERLGYATQKPVALLERIIKASSNEGDVIFDPFCGCATTVEAAHKLKRKWIGIDIAIHAIKRVSKARLGDRLGLIEGIDYTIGGIPRNVEGARDLWERDKYHFQKWAVEQVDGFVTAKRTADGGIDGRLYFTIEDDDKKLSSMVLEVKGGKNVGINDVRSLRGTLARDSALMAGLIILEPIGEQKMSNFKREMAQAGDLDVNGVKYEKVQILTVADILGGKRFDTPSRVFGRGKQDPVLPLGT